MLRPASVTSPNVHKPGTTPASKRGSGYLPSLDGWRALAIIGVMMTHDAPWHLGRFNNASWRGQGGDGVYLFFAISGLLITWRILEEEQLVGSFHVKRFYIRRFFRIQPAAFVYLAVVALLRLSGLIQEYWSSWFGALFLFQNFLVHSRDTHRIYWSLFTGHFWTLSVEEHFYLLLSVLLFCIRRFRIVAFAVLYLALRTGQRLAMNHGLFSADVSGRRTYWVIGYLLLPALVALIVHRPAIRALCVRWLRPWLVFPAGYLLVALRESHEAHRLVLNIFAGNLGGQRETILKLLIAFIISTMLHPAALTTRALEWSPLRFLGRISYSVYLWHVLFFHLTAQQVVFAPLHVLGLRPWKYLLTALFAVGSYYLVEKPMIRLGHRLAPSATPGRLDLRGIPDEPADLVPSSGPALTDAPAATSADGPTPPVKR